MSFSFRNLFSQDESENSEGAEASRDQSGDERASFLPDGTTSAFRGMRTETNQKSGASRTYTRYMVGELLPYIPPAIAAPSGIPMEQMLEIPLPADGSRDVNLSTLYQLCPNLFASEITPLNDSVITLPPKIEDVPPENGNQSGISAPGQGSLNPFSDASLPVQPSQPGPGHDAGDSGFGSGANSQNPFWSPEPEKSDRGQTESKFSGDQGERKEMPAASPFGNQPAPKSESPNLFSQGENSQQAPKGFLPPKGEPTSQPGEGFGFQNYHSTPEAEKSPSPATGPAQPANPFANSAASVEQPASQAPAAEQNEFSTLFSRKAEEDASIEPPGMSQSKGNGPEMNWGSPQMKSKGDEAKSHSFHSGPGSGQSPFEGTMETIESEVDEDDGEFEGYLPPAADEDTLSQIPGLVESEREREEEEQDQETSFDDEPVHFDDLMASVDEKESDSSRTSFFDELAHSPAPSQKEYQADPPKSEEKPESHFGNVASAHSERERSKSPGPEPVRSAPAFSSSRNIRDLELRAIFGVEDAFTIQIVAELVAKMDGVSSCAVSSPGGYALAGRQERSNSGESIREMSRNVRQLAEISGISDASAFTLQTDQGMVSLFLEGDSCLMVRHESSGFGPGVRERLILIARSLDRIES